MLKTLLSSVRMGLTDTWRRPIDAVGPLAFFFIVASLFPLAIGPESELLLRIAPGVVWVGALLSSTLSLPRLFEPDLANGTFEQLFVSSRSHVLAVSGRIATHWMTTGLPLSLLSPVIALQFGLSHRALAVLSGTLLLGTAVLSSIGAVGAALSLGSRGGSVLVALLVMPLYIPVLILGSGATGAYLIGNDISAHMLLLGALTSASVALAPWAATTALRLAVE